MSEQTMSEFFLGFQPEINVRGAIKVELKVVSGKKYYFTSRKRTHSAAMQEILKVVETMMNETKGNVIWRISGSDTISIVITKERYLYFI